MTDRNERHFLEFYTPARRRIDRLAAARRRTNFSDDKENPTNNEFGTAPATIAGEKASEVGRQRRRLFTRSASKQNYANRDNGNHGTEFASPTASGSTVSRALFSTDGNATPMAKKTSSPEFYSPPGSSRLLREYRAKQSLLSSSKTRISSLSSPRLRPTSLWKKGKGLNINEEKAKAGGDYLVAAIETTTTKNLETTPTVANVETDKLESPLDTGIKSVEEATPTSKKSPIAPQTKSKQSIFLSPPGTSKLLRKYRQRTQQLDQDASLCQSPPNTGIVSPDNYDRSRTTPRGRKGLRLLDSGAKRCRNNALSFRPRPTKTEGKTPSNSKMRGEIMAHSNRKLLSPLTAKRLDKDINSYRQAHGQDQLPKPLELAEKNYDSIEKIGNENSTSNDFNKNATDDHVDNNCDEAPEMSPSTHTLSNNAEVSAEGTGTNDYPNDEIPFDEQDAENECNASGVSYDSMQQNAIEGVSEKSVNSSKDTDSNPNGEESGVFQSTRSATRARHESTAERTDTLPNPLDIDKLIGSEKESGIFRSTRSATRSRLESAKDKAEGAKSKDATRVNCEEEHGVFRSTRSATRARRKALQQDNVKVSGFSSTESQSDEKEGNSDAARSEAKPSPSPKIATRPIDSIELENTDAGTNSKSEATSLSFPQEENDTSFSKGSLRSIWDAIHCVGSKDNSIDSSFSENMCHGTGNTNIISRVGDCVNPMAKTLMNMWREEANAAMEQNKSETTEADVECLPSGLKTPPKSFSSDLKLVYGLERVKNLTLARPKPLQSSKSRTGVSLASSTSSQGIIIPPLGPCSQ